MSDQDALFPDVLALSRLAYPSRARVEIESAELPYPIRYGDGHSAADGRQQKRQCRKDWKAAGK